MVAVGFNPRNMAGDDGKVTERRMTSSRRGDKLSIVAPRLDIYGRNVSVG